jgi:hypothetical protein
MSFFIAYNKNWILAGVSLNTPIPKHQAKKAYRGRGGKTLSTLDVGVNAEVSGQH